jgi:hypothetical protein
MRKYDTDVLAKLLYTHLIRDFRETGMNFRSGSELLLHTDLKQFRDEPTPSAFGAAPWIFKREAQLSALLSKYQFERDVYSQQELEERTLQGYFDTQERLAQPLYQKYTTKLVLKEARKIVKNVLGEYPEDDVILHARFGKKSNIGCPLHLAHIDYKLSTKKACTSSSKITTWFRDKVQKFDPILTRFLNRIASSITMEGITPELCIEFLHLKTVPKKWNILRMITPLTLLALFKSFGIGWVIEKRLAANKLNIRKLQQWHRKLVKKYSRSRTHVTADLSAASDSITRQLLMYLLPRKWWNEVKTVLTNQVLKPDGSAAYTMSVLPMGNGLTFPLETLVFYSIIKAIGNLLNVKGTYSVYGDDLIYPRQIHRFVEEIFPDLGFVLNRDKTFCDSFFRESCGADYFHGVDVRPFYFRGQSASLTRTQYLAQLYKTYNGLRLRWADEEIPSTLYFLLVEMCGVSDKLHRVPKSYPATSGIQTDTPYEIPLNSSAAPLKSIRWDSPFVPTYVRSLQQQTVVLKCEGKREIKTTNGQFYEFEYLSEQAEKRFVKYQEPYYWQILAGADDVVKSWDDECLMQATAELVNPHQLRRNAKGDFVNWRQWIDENRSFAKGFKPSPVEVFSWKKVRRHRKFYDKRKKRQEKIVRDHYLPCVAEKQKTKVLQVTGTVYDWA